MKSLFFVLTLALLAAPYAAPLSAAGLTPALQSQGADDIVSRRGCDTPRDIREHKRCR